MSPRTIGLSDSLCRYLIQTGYDPSFFATFQSAGERSRCVRLAGTGLVIEQALRLPTGTGIRLLMRSFAFTRGLWQAASPPGGQDVADEDAAFGFLHLPFETELTDALAEYWRGALAS